MGKLQKTAFLQELDTIQTFVTEEGLLSKYFNITDLPLELAMGKSSMLIMGSSSLLNNVVLKIELIDSLGKPIYVEPVFDYEESGGIRVSIEVYKDTASGAATLTILGELDPNEFDEEIPTQFQGIYNVKYTRTITINKTIPNVRPIRFHKRPKLDVFEIIKGQVSLRSTSTGSNVQTVGSIIGTPVPSTEGTSFTVDSDNIQEVQTYADQVYGFNPMGNYEEYDQSDPRYSFTIADADFSSSMIGGTLTISSPNVQQSFVTSSNTVVSSYSSKITKIVNKKTLEVQSPFGIYDSGSGFYRIAALSSGSYQINWPKFHEFDTSSINFKSYADIRLKKLRTFSGDVHRVAGYVKNNGPFGNWTKIIDTPVESPELLLDPLSITGTSRIGFFNTDDVVTAYWDGYATVAGQVEDETSVTLQTYSESEYLTDSVFMSGSGVDLLGDADYDFITLELKSTYAMSFISGTEYRLKAKLVADNRLGSQPTIKALFSMSGSAFGPHATWPDRYGRVIGMQEYQNSVGSVWGNSDPKFEAVFTPDSDGTAILQIRFTGGHWSVSEITIKPNSDTNFSPEFIRLISPVPPLQTRPDYLDFAFEFYDVNNNKSQTVLTTLPDKPDGIKFEGENMNILGNDNLIGGSVYVGGDSIGAGIQFGGVNSTLPETGGSGATASGFIRSVKYQGFTSASQDTSNTGFLIYSGSVFPDSGDDYSGVGLELVGESGSFRFGTDPSRFEVIADAFFVGNTTNQFISGSGGNIEISSSAFHLSPTGDVIMSGSVTATEGYIGNWQIKDGKLSGSNATLDAVGAALYKSDAGPDTNPLDGYYIDFTPGSYYVRFGTDFAVSSSGQLFASGAKIEGVLTSSEGYIGNWTIASNTLHYFTDPTYTGLSSTGDARFFAGATSLAASGSAPFNVKASGDITGSKVLFTGGKIAAFNISDDALYTDSFFISASATNNDLFISATNFNVSAKGDVSASDIYVSGGTTVGGDIIGGGIAGWSISATSIVDDNNIVKLEPAGAYIISSSDFQVSSAGEMTASAGKIAGFEINGTQLKQGTSFFLDGASDGSFFISSSDFQVTPSGQLTGSSALFDGNLDVTGTGTIASFVLDSSEIRDTGNKLRLKSSGQITASAANITGDITANTITANTAGTIANFDIDSIEIASSNNKLRLKSSGQITASAAQIVGKITAESGTIGGFNIGDDLTSAVGTLSLKGATGQITASGGSIGGWSMTTSSIESGNKDIQIFSERLAKSDGTGGPGFVIRDQYANDVVSIVSGSLYEIGAATDEAKNDSFEVTESGWSTDGYHVGTSASPLTVTSWSFSAIGPVSHSVTKRTGENFTQFNKALVGDYTFDVIRPGSLAPTTALSSSDASISASYAAAKIADIDENQYTLIQEVSASSQATTTWVGGNVISFAFVGKMSHSLAGAGYDRGLESQKYKVDYWSTGDSEWKQFIPAATGSDGFGAYDLATRYTSIKSSNQLPESTHKLRIVLSGSINSDIEFKTSEDLYEELKLDPIYKYMKSAGLLPEPVTGSATNVQPESAKYPYTELSFDNFRLVQDQPKIQISQTGFLLYQSENSYLKMTPAGMDMRSSNEGGMAFGKSVTGRAAMGGAGVFGRFAAPKLQAFDADPNTIELSAFAGNTDEYARGNHTHQLPFDTVRDVLRGNALIEFTSTGIDDNAEQTVITIDADEHVTFAGNIILSGTVDGVDVSTRDTVLTSTTTTANSALQPADTMYIGTTSIAFNRANAALTLAGITLTTPSLVTPVLGTPGSGDFSTGTFTWPTFNQSTTGTAATVTTNANLTGDVTSVGNATVIAADVIIDADVKSDAAIAYSKLGTVPTWNQNTTGTAANATLAAAVTVTDDSSTNTDFAIPYHNGSNALLDDTGVFTYNPNTQKLIVPNIDISGIQTLVNTATLVVTSSVTFEGESSDDFETNLGVTNPTADRTITLPNASGNVVLDTLTQTLTNKTLTTPIITSFTNSTHTHANADGGGQIAASAVSDFDAEVSNNITVVSAYNSGATRYTHPTHDGDDISIDTTALTGATVISDLDFNITTDTAGHVTDANGAISTRTLTLANLDYTGETDATADQTATEILTAIKTVDGAGSGLDADLLDGQTGTYYTDFSNITVSSGEVSNTMLANSSINFGGISLSLGDSDPHPAFALADAIGLPIVAGTTGTLSVARGGTGVTTSTGTGNVVLSASPTLTGTLAAAAGTFSGGIFTTGAGNTHLTLESDDANCNMIIKDSDSGGGLNIKVLGNVAYFATNNTTALTLDASQNATFAGTIGSGAITSTGAIIGTSYTGGAISGTSGTFTGEITVEGGNDYSATFENDVKIIDSGGNPRLLLGDDTGATGYGEISWNSSANSIELGTAQDPNTLTLDQSGNATFAGEIVVGTDAVAAQVFIKAETSGEPALHLKAGGASDCLHFVAGNNSANYILKAMDENSSNVVWSVRKRNDAETSENFDMVLTGNATFAGTLGSGAITSTGLITGTDLTISGTSTTIGTVTSGIWNAGAVTSTGTVAAVDGTFSGDLTVTGKLNITGDIDSYNVTDLDVVDKTITLGAGQIEANSGGSGIVIDGSSASMLWDESNTEWDFNNSINVTGAGTFSGDINANGNIVGDGSTAISSMASLGIGSVTATGTVQAEQITSTDDITASGTVQAEHLYSTDDAQIDDDLTVSGDINANGNIVGDGSTAMSSMASLGIGTVTATGLVTGVGLTTTGAITATDQTIGSGAITSTGLITGVGLTTTGAITATDQTIASAAITSTGLITGTDLSISGTTTTIGTVTSGIWNASDIALGTYTSGNYVGTLAVGAGMAAVNADGEGSSKTIAVDGILEDLDTLGAAASDGQFIVATGAGAFGYESTTTARTSLGVGEGDAPSFAGLTSTEDIILSGTGDTIYNSFLSGIMGTGWRIDYDTTNGGSHLEIDNITVRNTLQTHIFQKDVVKATNGYLYISDSGVISGSVSASNYIYFIDDKSATFVEDDRLWFKSADITGSGVINSVKFDIAAVDANNPQTGVTRYTVDNIAGDLGNVTVGGIAVKISGGSILLDASSANGPYMDIISGLSTEGTSTNTVVRTGNLSGITSTRFGELSGFGFWASGSAYLEGTINAKSGNIGAWGLGESIISSSDGIITLDADEKRITIRSDATTDRIYLGEVTGSSTYGMKIFDGSGTTDTSLLVELGSARNKIVGWDLVPGNIQSDNSDGSVRLSSVSQSLTIWTGSMNEAEPKLVLGKLPLNDGTVDSPYGFAVFSGSGTVSGSEANASVLITANKARLAGWELGPGQLTSGTVATIDGNQAKIALGTNATTHTSAIPQPNLFFVSASTSPVFFVGENFSYVDNVLTAAGWKIGSGMISSSNGNAILSGSGVLSLGTGTHGYNEADRIYIDGTAGDGRMSMGTGFRYTDGELTIDGNASIAGWTINAGSISKNDVKLDSTEAAEGLYVKKTSYSSTTAGGFLGLDSGVAKFNVGDNSKYIKFDGAHFTVDAGNFSLDSSGNMTATSAALTGDLTATSIQADSGSIGGFGITSTEISSSGASGNTGLRLKASGQITASAAKITGDITATGGSIGGFTIDGHSLTATGIEINDATQTTFINTSAFKVDHTGNITASNVDLSGNITATGGSFTGDVTAGTTTINAGGITGSAGGGFRMGNEGLVIGGGSITLGSNFAVDSAGNMTASNAQFSGSIKALGGTFDGDVTAGTVTIGTGGITGSAGSGFRMGNEGLVIGEGSITLGSNFTVDSSGNMTASNAQFSGSIQAASGTFTGDVTAGTVTIGTGGITGSSAGGFRMGNEGLVIGGGSITLGSNFAVDSAGNMTASNAQFSGSIQAASGTFTGDVTAGTVTIGTGGITGSSAGGFRMGNEGLIIGGGSITLGSNFSVDSSGNMTASNAQFSGSIQATSGTFIGDVTAGTTTINAGGITGSAGSGFRMGNEGLVMGEGSITLGSNFAVDSAGNMTASNAQFSGSIKALGGHFAGDVTAGTVTIGDGGITGTNFTLDGSGLAASSATISGDITADSIIANSGSIGGFGITTSEISSSNASGNTGLRLKSSGQITASAAKITGDITATTGTFTNVTVSTGTIGGFTIGTNLTEGNKAAWNDANSGIFIGATGIGLGEVTAGFSVSAAGALTASSADITGAINATSGDFSGTVNIGSAPSNRIQLVGTNDAATTLIKQESNKFQIRGDGYAKFANGQVVFEADGSGTLGTTISWTTGGVLSVGKITATAGSVGGFGIDQHSLTATGIEINDATQALFISSSAFKVDHTGNITASNVALSGEITADTGAIGGFTIGDDLTYGSKAAWNDANSGIFIGTDGIGLGPVATGFSVSAAGILKATGADITGDLTATSIQADSGSIAGWDIQPTYLVDASNKLKFEPAGDYIISSSMFKVSAQGNVTASNIEITQATIRGGTAENWIGDSSYLSFVGGGTYNIITGSSFYSTIGSGAHNTIISGSDFSSIVGGMSGSISSGSDMSFIGGGRYNKISGSSNMSFIGGGQYNKIYDTSNFSYVGGGESNLIYSSSYYSSILGGEDGEIYSNSNFSTVIGGDRNVIYNECELSFIGAGYSNQIFDQSDSSIIVGGVDNTISFSADGSSIIGGFYNRIESGSNTSFIGGGSSNKIIGEVGAFAGNSANVIGGGWLNEIREQTLFAVIAGGLQNAITPDSDRSAIVGGSGNKIMSGSDLSFIGGGGTAYSLGNVMDNAEWAVIVGGEGHNITNNDHSFIGGGENNTISSTGEYNAILGGYDSTIGGSLTDTFIIGSGITADASNTTFVEALTSIGNIRAGGDIVGDGSTAISGITSITATGKIDTSGEVEAEHLHSTDDIEIGDRMYHSGDTDTYIQFNSNGIDLYAGNRENISLYSTGTVINESSLDHNFRVESNGEANMLFVNGGTNQVSIGSYSTSSPFEGDADRDFEHDSPFTVFSTGELGNTAADTVGMATFGYEGVTNHGHYLEFFGRRETTDAGGSWESAGTRMQHVVNNVGQGYIEFNGAAGSYGLSLGTSASGTSIGSYQSSPRLIINGSGGVGIGATPAATAGHIRASNDIVAYYSDRRLKETVGSIENPIDKIKGISTLLYKHNDLAQSFGFTGNKIHIGVDAHSVKETVPQAVELAPFDADEDGNSKSGEDYLTVQYERLVPLLIEGMKDQQKQIEDLQQQIEEIKNGS